MLPNFPTRRNRSGPELQESSPARNSVRIRSEADGSANSWSAGSRPQNAPARRRSNGTLHGSGGRAVDDAINHRAIETPQARAKILRAIDEQSVIDFIDVPFI